MVELVRHQPLDGIARRVANHEGATPIVGLTLRNGVACAPVPARRGRGDAVVPAPSIGADTGRATTTARFTALPTVPGLAVVTADGGAAGGCLLHPSAAAPTYQRTISTGCGAAVWSWLTHAAAAFRYRVVVETLEG